MNHALLYIWLHLILTTILQVSILLFIDQVIKVPEKLRHLPMVTQLESTEPEQELGPSDSNQSSCYFPQCPGRGRKHSLTHSRRACAH